MKAAREAFLAVPFAKLGRVRAARTMALVRPRYRGGGCSAPRERTIALSTKRTKAPNQTTPEQYAARFNAEKAALQRAYCGIFKFWRSCPHKPCRKARACRGDAHACLKQGIKDIPYQTQWDARQKILEVTPADLDPAERTAREFLPSSFYGGP